MRHALAAAIAAFAGLFAGAAGAATNERYTVLSYHEISDAKDALIPRYAVAPAHFRKQIDWLRTNGFNFISVDDIIAEKKGRKRLPEKAVLITFDDGYRSTYDHALPYLKSLGIPSVVAVVGLWEEDAKTVDFDGKSVPRDMFMTWRELRSLTKGGLVEIASHAYDLHKGAPGNPQGNMEPAATTRLWNSDSKSYESEHAYRARVGADLKRSRDSIKRHTGRAPRVIAWPYGRYNHALRDSAAKLGMVVGLTLEDGANIETTPLSRVRRVLVESNMSVDGLKVEMERRNRNYTDNDIPQKIAHIDLDNIYDPDPAQQERNLGLVLDRLQALGVNTVYLQAFADPDGNGSADAVYFPNRRLPMRADLFNRVAWQIETRTQVRRVYAWMPLLAWELPKSDPAAADQVVTLPSEKNGRVNMGYIRLSPYSERARQAVRDIFEDLGRAATFEGVLFHDDATLSDYEDGSDYALKAYQKAGLPGSVLDIRANKDLMRRWTTLKINTIDDFARDMAQTLRAQIPDLRTARNLYALVALNPDSEEWYGQALGDSLEKYDFTAIMAMPWMEQAPDREKFYRDMVERVKQYPRGLRHTVFELQTVDWRKDNTPIPMDEITATITSLYKQGVRHIAYYPDQPFANHPDPEKMRAAFATRQVQEAPR